MLCITLLISCTACISQSTADSNDQNSTAHSNLTTEADENESYRFYELHLDGIHTFDDLEAHIEEQLDTAIDELNSKWNTFQQEIDSYEKYTSNLDKVTDFYQTVISETELMCIMLYEYSAAYARMILDSDLSAKEKYQAVEGIYDSLYEDACDEIHDEIYDGILDEMYDYFYDGILDEAYDNIEYSIWYKMSSDEYSQWYDASSEAYSLCYDTASDIYSFCYDLSDKLYSNDLDRAEKRYDRFLSKIDKLKNPETDISNTNTVFDTSIRNAANPDELETIVYEHVTDCVNALNHEWKTLSAEINTFELFQKKSDAVESFHSRIEEAASQILLMICDYSVIYADLLLNSNSSAKDLYKDFVYFKDIFYDTACDIVKDGIYEDLLKEIKDTYYEGMIYDAKDSVQYSTWSDARSDSYSWWSDAREEVYESWSDTRSDLYDVYSDVRSECYSGDLTQAFEELQKFNSKLTAQTEENINSTENSSEEISSNGIRQEFKDAMDSYEAFFDEYIAFMNKYNESDTDDMLEMMNDYTSYMTQYAETMEKLESVDTDELTAEEALYYTEVFSRITSKLLEIAN